MPLTITPTALNSESVLGSTFNVPNPINTFTDSGLSITLPGAGTYLVYGSVRAAIRLATGSDGAIITSLQNVTDSVGITNSERTIVFVSQTGVDFQLSCGFAQIVSVTGSKQINLYVQKSSLSSGTFTTATLQSDSSGRTNLGYVKLSA
jgi:hypothetical protein